MPSWMRVALSDQMALRGVGLGELVSEFPNFGNEIEEPEEEEDV